MRGYLTWVIAVRVSTEYMLVLMETRGGGMVPPLTLPPLPCPCLSGRSPLPAITCRYTLVIRRHTAGPRRCLGRARLHKALVSALPSTSPVSVSEGEACLSASVCLRSACPDPSRPPQDPLPKARTVGNNKGKPVLHLEYKSITRSLPGLVCCALSKHPLTFPTSRLRSQSEAHRVARVTTAHSPILLYPPPPPPNHHHHPCSRLATSCVWRNHF